MSDQLPVTKSDAQPSWLQRGHIPSLDGLRALAILMVLFAHFTVPFGDLLPVHALKGRCGFLGVQLFFVLSGFLITTLMLREVERRGQLNLRQFYLRRVLRIVPAYVAYLAVLALLAHWGMVNLSGRQWLAVGTYTVNFLPPSVPILISHIWSLSVEEHFYLLWPLLVAVWPLARCRSAALVCLAAALVLRWVMLLTMPAQCPVDVWTFTRLDDIAIGCLLAFLARDPLWRNRLDRFVAGNGSLLLLVAAFLASQVICSRLAGERWLGHVPAMFLVGLANDCNSLTIALLMWAALARPGSMVGRVLNHRIPRGIGVISYSLYLWHMPFCAFERLLPFAFPLNFLGSFLAAGMSFVLIERPFLALKARLESRPARGARCGNRSPAAVDGVASTGEERVGNAVGAPAGDATQPRKPRRMRHAPA